MTGYIMAFIIWMLVGAVFVGMGIYEFFSKKETPFGFWANARTPQIADVKGYNRALGKLWIVFGVVFMLFGIPLLSGQNSPAVLFSVLGIMLAVIAVMAGYTVIEAKYRKK